MAAIINKPWSNGGTGVTNFSIDQIDLYRESVRQYGSMELVVSDVPMPPMIIGGSLHDLRSVGIRDLSDFWSIFRYLERFGASDDPVDDHIKAYNRAMKGIK